MNQLRQKLVSFIRNHKVVALFLAAIAVIAIWELSASLRGELAAHLDIARGRYELLGYGLPPFTRPEYARLLRERYGIEYHAVAGCVVSWDQMEFVEGYDSVSTSAAKRKFGHDVFKECEEDARKNVEQSAIKAKQD